MIYLDNAATTKPDLNAIEMSNYINETDFFNPSAKYHGGLITSGIISKAKESFSKIFGSNFEVIFTSCGTESDNTAIFSYARRGNAVTTLGEHSAVYECYNALKKAGYDSRFAEINKDGSVSIDSLLKQIDKNTVFVSVVHVNNETGAINDINYIAKKCKEINPRLIFHSDGVQAFGKINVKLSNYVDLYSLSAHKIGGLKGVGALIKNKNLKNLKPYIIGGGQENGLRSGTENVFGIKIFEKVALDKFNNFERNFNHVKNLNKVFLDGVDKSVFTVISGENSSPYVVSISARGLRGEVLQHKLESCGVLVGTGSACSSKKPHSRVLKSAGYSSDILDGVIRISFNYDTNVEDVKFAVEKINENAISLKKAMYNL